MKIIEFCKLMNCPNYLENCKIFCSVNEAIRSTWDIRDLYFSSSNIESLKNCVNLDTMKELVKMEQI